MDIFDAEIAKIYDTFDCKLHTITGIGKTLAAVIFSEIGGDISKFSSVLLNPKKRQFGLLPFLPLSKTLRQINFMKENALKVNII